ncbi:SpaH/EbpB family LPXTG-anchored major pilin [Arcanobacterium phocae]|uniref:SpaH/EbpB family LPXTG-anchored major pilin n=1 Tax=Arcanobacterium phocae TaxID=131112 RepID=UPI001C114ACB
MFNRKNRKRGLFTAMSLTLVAALGFAGAPAALAAEGDMPTEGQGTIAIHKYDSAQGKKASSDGTEQNVDNTPLEGVKFTVTKLTDFDIKKNTDWEKLAKLNGHALDIEGTTLSAKDVPGEKFVIETQPADEIITKQDGSAETKKLDFGAYLVQETDFGKNLITKKVDPFVVTIPYPNQAQGTTTWLTKVHVYPKNDLTTPGTKEVVNEDKLRNVGDNIEWKITTKAPADASKFGIVDQLEDYLTYVDGTAKVTFGTKELTKSEYAVTEGNKFGKKFVQIKLNQTGLETIKAGGDITFTLTTTLNDKLPSGGIVDNHAFPINNDLDPFNDTSSQNPPPTPPIDTPKKPHYGQYQFTKVDSKNDKPLAGAVFQICDSADTDCVNPLDEVTADENGVVNFKGIFLGLGDSATSREVILHEKTAPSGYVLRPDEKITIKVGSMELGDNKVKNEPQAGPNLPMTGAAGTVLLTLAGVAVFAIATGLAFVNKRRKNA